MAIQLNTDNHIIVTEALKADVETKVNSSLDRFSDRITRIEVHLSDVNSIKTGPKEKRCLIEARVAGMRPSSVSHQAPTISLAVDGAREKMVAALDAVFGKHDAVRHEKIIPSDDLT